MSIVIVGAGPNLGLAIARRFGREGLPVGLVSRDQAKLDKLATQLEGEGVKALGRVADIRDPPAWTPRSARWPASSAPSRCSSTRRCPPASS
jgi:short-subunit dehydrogenase